MATVSHPSIDEFMRTWLPRLPQGARITAADARSWYDAVLAREPERFAWHYERLSGFGGSDVGELGAWRLGVPALFKRPSEVIAQKLMQRTIEGSSDKYIRRGVLMEDDIRETFLADYRARSCPDLIDALREARSQAHPWGRANPDDVVDMRVGRKMKRYVVDYKSISEAKDVAPTQYACQIHHYDWMLWAAGSDAQPRLSGDKPLACDGLLIVYYDYAAAEVVVVEVPWDGTILRAVLESGDLAWDSVLGRQEVDFSLHAGTASHVERLRQDEEERIAEIERRMVVLKLLADPLYQRYKEHARQIERILDSAGRRVKSKTQPSLTYFSLFFKSNLDLGRLGQLCATAGIDPDSLRSDTQTVDVEATTEKLRALGHSPVYKREYDLERIREWCTVNGYRVPLEEAGVFSISRRRAAQPKLEPLREIASKEAARAADTMVASLGGAPPLIPDTHLSESSPASDQEMSGVRALTLRMSAGRG